MIYTLQEGQSFDPEILRQELVKAIGPDGWSLNTAGNEVNFVTTNELLITDEISSCILAHFSNGPTRESNKAILKQIAALEATQTPRRIREGGAWIP